MNLLLNCAGILVLLCLLYLLSWKRKHISVSMILKGVAVQFVLALLLVKVPAGQMVVSKVSDLVTNVINCGQEGLRFVFGTLADGSAPTGFIFAIQTLGIIVFLSALVNLLHYIGVLGFVVKWIGKAVGKLMGTTEAESFIAVANMFLGQTDSPILVSKYLSRMTDSEIMVVLVSGMGSMSVSSIGGYAALGIPVEYILIASTLVPIGSILVSKMLLPQTETVVEIEDIQIDNKGGNTNLIEAIAEGATTGCQMALNIGASLIAMVSIVAVVNMVFGVFGTSLQELLSYVFAPFGYLLGLSGPDALLEGSLLGEKFVLNEFISFQQLGTLVAGMDHRTGLVMTISLCGFANVASLGICVSGIGVLCPERKSTLARLAFKAMLGGFSVSLLSAMIVGLVTLI